MIKQLTTISKKDFDYLVNHPFIVVEKMDMLYFRVQVTNVGTIPIKNSSGKVISDIDCLTNTVYKEICEFVNTNINPVRQDLINRYGEGYIGFFYLPVHTYNKITYKDIEPRSVILSDWSYQMNLLNTEDTPRINELSELLKVYSPSVLLDVNDTQQNIDSIKTNIIEYLENNISNKEFVENIITMSSDDIEGIIFRTDKFQYQVSLVPVDVSLNIDKSTKLSYRNIILSSVADYYTKNKELLDSEFRAKTSYIDKIIHLFLKYIDSTDIFSKYSLDPDDLLPPSNSYIGDIDYDMISDANVRLICKYNAVHKNIFRLFLHTFAVKTSENKFKGFSKSQTDILNNLILTLDYRNYKEILLNAYQSKTN